MPWHNGWWAFGPWWFFPFVMPAVMIIGIVVMLIIVRSLFWGGGPWWLGRPSEPGEDQALAILRRRFASGEISEREYEAKRQLLQRS
jgi:uncharacterized membrane protein